MNLDKIAHNLPERPHFDTIFFPDGTCGVFDGTADCHKQGVVLGVDTFNPETGTWFCSEHWPEFDVMMDIVEDKRPLVLFFQAVADITAMKIVEDIFHYESEENESYDEEIERLEDFLSEETPYSYIGINNIIYLYKGDDVIADLDTDDYTWKRADEGFNPIAAANALIDAIADKLKE